MQRNHPTLAALEIPEAIRTNQSLFSSRSDTGAKPGYFLEKSMQF
ncbi:hypothetical protein DEALK_06370 [Dehalogenimonas alkenigignens]|uniref:Uncharacterized protein n=1 Tax=Dehalogenimonas alkenigignens TaxID=1217799 RepID=A0A0W0GGU7_9CHLR|nr:hypothetical protein DEALK_06370 [Dehalogenimonas alkenigignens]